MTHVESDVRSEVEAIGRRARNASIGLARASRDAKDRALEEAARAIEAGVGEVLEANARDLEGARERGTPSAMLDRLALDEARLAGIAASIREVATLPDPVGEVTGMWVRPNGLRVGRQRIPLGVVGIVYEARPNVTVETASLCLKSGNACVLKGGSEAFHSNLALAARVREGIERAGLEADAVQLVPTTDRAAVGALLELDELIDVIIPRGGEGLIRYVAQHSRIPVIKHYKGTCHVYVDASADPEMARRIAVNAKCQRPSVCNAAETLLVHADWAARELPALAAALIEAGVELRGCERTRELVPGAGAATDEDWGEEFLDLILAVRVVDDLDQAIDHIERWGSSHSETIVTADYASAERFQAEVRSSVTFVNASTRFSDGGQLGLGAEIGISTTKLHAYGPMGLEELTTRKFVVYGEGQIRE